MTKIILLGAAALIFSGSALAQEKSENSGLRQMSNCHAPTNGAPAWNSQPIENSAILPSVGGDTPSAAGTVQRHGLSVEARSDCPPESSDPASKTQSLPIR